MNKENTIFGEAWPFTKAKSTLLGSAAVVMREQGPRSATLKNIANKAGVTEPAIFRHFDGVDGLFDSLFQVVGLYFDRFQSFYKNPELAGLDRLEVAYSRIVETIADNADYSYLLVNPDPVFREYRKMREKLRDFKKRDHDSVVSCIREAKAKGQLLSSAEVEPVAQSIVGSTLVLMQAWIDNPASMDIVKEARKLWSGLRSSFGKPTQKAAKIAELLAAFKAEEKAAMKAASFEEKPRKAVKAKATKAAGKKPKASKAAPAKKAAPARKAAAAKKTVPAKKTAPARKPAVQKKTAPAKARAGKR